MKWGFLVQRIHFIGFLLLLAVLIGACAGLPASTPSPAPELEPDDTNTSTEPATMLPLATETVTVERAPASASVDVPPLEAIGNVGVPVETLDVAFTLMEVNDWQGTMQREDSDLILVSLQIRVTNNADSKLLL